MIFLNGKHEQRFKELMEKAEVSFRDKERSVAMFILSGNDDLYRKADKLYNFKEGCFDYDIVDPELYFGRKIDFKVDLSSTQRKLATLALDLFGAKNNIHVYDLFSSLNSDNRKLALNAIEYAFS